MKTTLFAITLASAIAGVSLPTLAAQKTVVLSVPSMDCEACPITVRKSLEKVSGVEKAKATFQPKEAVVTYDDAKTSVEKLTEATKRAGYPSSVKPGQ